MASQMNPSTKLEEPRSSTASYMGARLVGFDECSGQREDRAISVLVGESGLCDYSLRSAPVISGVLT